MADTSRLNPQDIAHLDNINASTRPSRLRPSVPVSPSSRPWRIILYIGEDNLTAVGLDITGQVTIGRADVHEGHMPGLDLTPHGARDAGVSRRHAMMFAIDGNLLLRDLGSTNGTRINGFLLDPNQTYKVQEGDRIEFGNLQTRVHIVQSFE